MTPTQAQIDAAAKAIHETNCDVDGDESCTFCIDAAEAALTAAAEVSMKDEDARTIIIGLIPDGVTADKLTLKAREEIRAAFETVLRLTAAAEVGSPIVDAAIANAPLVQEELRRIKADTIERCARVADKYCGPVGDAMRNDIAPSIAAAIRALATDK